jgi:hypothetical protein
MGVIMGNLLSEYRRRHNSNFIWASNDGICFFNKNRKPAAICLVTETSRVINHCDLCHVRQPKFICEIYSPNKFNNIGELINLLCHEHIEADADVTQVINKIDSSLMPYYAKDQKDIESWLWNFFLQTDPFSKKYSNSFEEFVKQQGNRNSNVMRSIEQMLWTISTVPNIYPIYYQKLYQPFIIGRNYMLYR